MKYKYSSPFEEWRKKLKIKWFFYGFVCTIFVPFVFVIGARVGLYNMPLGIVDFSARQKSVIEYVEGQSKEHFFIKGVGEKLECLVKHLSAGDGTYRPAVNCEVPGIYKVVINDKGKSYSMLFETHGNEVRLRKEVSSFAQYNITYYPGKSVPIKSENIFVVH